MQIQTDKLPRVTEWDCEHPSFPVGYIVQYRGVAHQVVDCSEIGQGSRLAAINPVGEEGEEK